MQTTTFDCEGTRITFRPLTVNDYDAARALLPGVSRCNKRHSPEDVAALLQLTTFHPCCCIRQDTGQLVGYAELHRLPHLGRTFDGRLERVIVTPDWRGKGLASALCTEMVRQARDHLGCGRVELTVEKPDARHIYETKLKFKPVDTTVMRLMFQSGVETTAAAAAAPTRPDDALKNNETNTENVCAARDAV